MYRELWQDVANIIFYFFCRPTQHQQSPYALVNSSQTVCCPAVNSLWTSSIPLVLTSRELSFQKNSLLYTTPINIVLLLLVFGRNLVVPAGRSTGFALIYDDEAAQKKFEPKYRLVRVRYFSSFLLSVLSPKAQSGLAKKVEKPSRKLRKERKNRAKKVIMQFSIPSSLVAYNVLFSSAPRYQKGQGCRAPQEGQVNVGYDVSHLPYMHHVPLAQQNIIGICLSLCLLHVEVKKKNVNI